MAERRTAWFPANVKPVHKGVYERRHFADFAYWNGNEWGVGCPSPTIAMRPEWRTNSSNFQSCQWRGLASKLTKGK